MPDIGYTFEPGGNQKKLLNGVNQGRLGPQANEALRVLSLRLPNVLGGSPISPEDLLRPRVGGSGPGSAVLDSLRSSGTPGPAPLLNGARTGGSAGVVHLGPQTDSIGKLADAAVNGPGRPTITPGDGDNRSKFTPPAPPVSATPQPGPVANQPGPSGGGAPDAGDVFDMFMRRILRPGGGGFNREL